MLKNFYLIAILNLAIISCASDRSNPQPRQNGVQNEQVSCWDLVKFSTITCCFPCLLLFSNEIIKMKNFSDNKTK